MRCKYCSELTLPALFNTHHGYDDRRGSLFLGILCLCFPFRDRIFDHDTYYYQHQPSLASLACSARRDGVICVN